jgi:hypothetical protein
MTLLARGERRQGMSDLSADELTVLMIAARGESMMSIGRWKAPTESLIARGYLRPRPSNGDPEGHHNAVITDEGRAVCKVEEDAPFKALIETGSKIGATQKGIRDFAEQAAQLLAQAARASNKVTGDAPEYAAEQWSGIILRRALEILRE